MTDPKNKISVLIVDDSAMVRRLLAEGLSADPGIEVVGTAGDAYEARDLIVRLQPDVVTLDIELPRMDGLEFLRRIMPRMPIRAVMVSALTGRGQEITLRALEMGAVDFVAKPSGGVESLKSTVVMLRQKVRAAAQANVSHWKGRMPEPPPQFSVGAQRETASKLIVLGASTGGTEAMKVVLHGLPLQGPGVVLVQHMPDEFTRLYADRLDEMFEFSCREARHGDAILPGRVLVAPGGRQARVKRTEEGFVFDLGGRERCNGHAPSVDTMFHSVAQEAGPDAVAAIFTGMGRDGATGLLACRQAGAHTLAQDESSCTVYGMPKVALEEGAVDRTTPLIDIPREIVRWMKQLRLAS